VPRTIQPGDTFVHQRELIARIHAKGNLTFVVMETESHNQHGRLVVKGTWTAIVRH
jgi:hypothetical protein